MGLVYGGQPAPAGGRKEAMSKGLRVNDQVAITTKAGHWAIVVVTAVTADGYVGKVHYSGKAGRNPRAMLPASQRIALPFTMADVIRDGYGVAAYRGKRKGAEC